VPIISTMRDISGTNVPPKRLREAWESGVLNARCQRREELLRVYGRWCWRMGLPMVWFEPRSRSSRLSRVHLDLFTTAERLSVQGRAALIALSARYVPAEHGSVGIHEAVWDHVGPSQAAEFARSVFRVVRRAGNCERVMAAAPVAANPRLVSFPVARLA
jgi:hypothetical protein